MLRIVGSIIAAALLSGCTPGAKTEIATPDGEPATPAGIWVEAKLPEGFPPPGPIDQIVVKDYPAYRIAVKKAEGDGKGRAMFRPLFNHITSRDIAMTAPVEMIYGGERFDRVTAMAFMYREPSMGKAGAAEDGVVVKDVPAQTVLSIGVRGGYSDESFASAHKKIRAWLNENPRRFKPVGPPRYFGYNSPFVPGFLKYGEVQLPVVGEK